jgi:DNA (cytosine-5)-methyltransferase 1
MSRNKRKKTKSSASRPASTRICAIDLFCGIGGLTRGLERAGINVALGVDIDPACEYAYTTNNQSSFLLKSVVDLSALDLAAADESGHVKLLAGCAPCQPFSTYRWKADSSDEKWNLLDHFGRLVKELKPDLITMENVPNLQKQGIFRKFVRTLKREGFHVSHEIVDSARFGVPQHRERLVLLASKFGPIELVSKKKKLKTVRQAISALTPLRAGQTSRRDPLHQVCELSELNLKRIRASKPGGTWRDWNKKLIAACHKRKSGRTYPGVYGRMSWDQPAPTMTTQYYGFGNGRFGHPSQDRAISLREGAILQSFPRSYKFVAQGKPIHRKTIGRLIGNAVPVKLAEAIGEAIVSHVRSHARTHTQAV